MQQHIFTSVSYGPGLLAMSETQRDLLSVTMLASCRYPRTAGGWVPCLVGPTNLRAQYVLPYPCVGLKSRLDYIVRLFY
jgi:hypothetical protein